MVLHIGKNTINQYRTLCNYIPFFICDNGSKIRHHSILCCFCVYCDEILFHLIKFLCIHRLYIVFFIRFKNRLAIVIGSSNGTKIPPCHAIFRSPFFQ